MIKDLGPERVERVVSIIREAVANLSEIKEMPQSTFMADKHKQASAMYNFIVGIEAAIDLGRDLISRKAF
jgi:uncharacterized protein YutE (UPF0331/DUF86 family)